MATVTYDRATRIYPGTSRPAVDRTGKYPVAGPRTDSTRSPQRAITAVLAAAGVSPPVA